MNAAKKALENSKNLFPQLDHQKRVIANSLKRQKVQRKPRESDDENDQSEFTREKVIKSADSESRLPKQYQKRMNVVSDASDISSSSLDENSSNDSDSDCNSIFKHKPRENYDNDEDDVSMKSIDLKSKNSSYENAMEPISSSEPEQIDTLVEEKENLLEEFSSDLSDGEIDD